MQRAQILTHRRSQGGNFSSREAKMKENCIRDATSQICMSVMRVYNKNCTNHLNNNKVIAVI